MTADYTQVGEESPREACANLCHELRALSDPSGGAYTSVAKTTLATWASRLERAVAKLDAEQAKRGDDQKRSEGEDAWQHLW